MKYFSFGRLASGGLLILLGTFPLLKAATNGYHLLKKYTFGAAEGAPANTLITSRPILPRDVCTFHMAQK
jgi:hypothetical protein